MKRHMSIVAAAALAGLLIISARGAWAGAITEADIPATIGKLGSTDSVERSNAVDALAGLGSKSVPYLIDALKKGGDYDGIMETLWLVRDDRAVRPVAKYINDKSWDRANRARGVLAAYGDMAVPFLAGLIKDPSYRDASIEVLKVIKPAGESLKLMRGLTGSVNSGERGAAALVLGSWKDTESAGTFETLMKDRDPAVRLQALNGYEELFSDSRRYNQELLIDIIKTDSSVDNRVKAASILSQTPAITDNTVVSLIELIRKEKDKRVLYSMLQAVAVVQDWRLVVPLLETLVEQDDPGIKAAAILGLGYNKADEAVPYIIDIFKKEVQSEELLDGAFLALAEIGKPVDVRMFLKYLDRDAYEGSSRDLLKLINMMAVPGDKEVIDAVEAYKKKTKHDAMAVMSEEALKKLR